MRYSGRKTFKRSLSLLGGSLLKRKISQWDSCFLDSRSSLAERYWLNLWSADSINHLATDVCAQRCRNIPPTGHRKALTHGSGLRDRQVIALRRSRCNLVKLRGTLLVLCKHDVDLRVCGHRDNHSAVYGHAHHLGVACGADVLRHALS